MFISQGNRTLAHPIAYWQWLPGGCSSLSLDTHPCIYHQVHSPSSLTLKSISRHRFFNIYIYTQVYCDLGTIIQFLLDSTIPGTSSPSAETAQRKIGRAPFMSFWFSLQQGQRRLQETGTALSSPGPLAGEEGPPCSPAGSARRVRGPRQELLPGPGELLHLSTAPAKK